MGSELLLAVVGPLIAGTVSVILYIGTRNGKAIDLGFRNLTTTIEKIDTRITEVDDKVDILRKDVSENYVSNSRFEDHIDLMSSMITRHAEKLERMGDGIKELREKNIDGMEKLRGDIGEIKELQWKTRLGVLDLIDRKLGRTRWNSDMGEIYTNDPENFGKDTLE